MTFSIAMRTVRREGVDYLGPTLARLCELGALQHPSVVGLHVSHGTQLSSVANGLRALDRAAMDLADWVLFLEDDLDFLDDFVGSVERWLEAHERPRIHLYPLACNYSQCFESGTDAWNYRTGAYYGSQAFVLRTWMVSRFIEWANEHWQSHRGLDLALARWHEQEEPETTHLVTPVPCFVDHVGDISSLGCAVGRFAGFGGRKFSYRSRVGV